MHVSPSCPPALSPIPLWQTLSLYLHPSPHLKLWVILNSAQTTKQHFHTSTTQDQTIRIPTCPKIFTNRKRTTSHCTYQPLAKYQKKNYTTTHIPHTETNGHTDKHTPTSRIIPHRIQHWQGTGGSSAFYHITPSNITTSHNPKSWHVTAVHGYCRCKDAHRWFLDKLMFLSIEVWMF